MGFSPFRASGVTCRTDRAFDGYTLFAQVAQDEISLIDMAGEKVHGWKAPRPGWVLYTEELLPNGNLLALFTTTKEKRPGGASAIAELDWDGKIVWSYESPNLHHHFTHLRNGNTMVIEWAPLPPDTANAVFTARDGAAPTDGRPMLGDILREITPRGEVVWEWRSEVALDPARDVTCRLHKFDEWTHCNSVVELENGDLLLSFRLIDTIAILDRKTGKFRWTWGPGVLGHQHDASMLPNGNILVFNNEWHKVGQLDASTLTEVNPESKTVVWSYAPTPFAQFFTAYFGTAQRLPNGNTLACEGSCGRIFEVTKTGEVVWEFNHPVTPLAAPELVPPRRFGVVSARRYGPDAPEVARLRSR